MFLRDTSNIHDRNAIVDIDGNKYTYGELELLSEKYGQDIPARSLVMILCDYCIDTVAFYYCQMNNHVVPIMVDRKLEEQLLVNLIQTYKPEYIWCTEEQADILSPYIEKIMLKKRTHVLLKTHYGRCRMHSELALLLTTSGSTGSAKLVRISYDGLKCNTEDYVKAIGLKQDDRAITTLPMCYCYGLSILHLHWFVGASVFVTEYSVLQPEFWQFFEGASITNMAGVPFIYDMLLRIGFFEKKYPSLRFLTQAGAKLPENKQKYIAEALMKKQVSFYICYGQTEATTYISLLETERVLDKSGSVGRALEHVKIKVDNPNEQGEGELLCKGESISMGYAAGRDDLMSESEEMRILKTGDIAYVDEEGYIFLRGRSKRFVKILGVRTSLDEIEQILLQEYLECEFACMGKDNKIKIYFTGSLSEKDIVEYCKRKLSLNKKFIECRCMEFLPKNSSGKIDYNNIL